MTLDDMRTLQQILNILTRVDERLAALEQQNRTDGRLGPLPESFQDDITRSGEQLAEKVKELLALEDTRPGFKEAYEGKREPVTDSKGQVMCTTDGRPVDEARASQTNDTGQHASYVVLCEEERRKGFVRPYREGYQHVGRSSCGKIREYIGPSARGGEVKICDDEHGHAGECWNVTMVVSQPEQAEIERSHKHPGCGTVTTMGRALSETYARDPKFYGATFCCGCNKHLPVAEFIWTADGQRVGS